MKQSDNVEKRQVQAVILPKKSASRLPAAAPADLGESYFEAYDQKTLFYDAFLTIDGNHIELLGPPLMNLEQDILEISLAGQLTHVQALSRRKLTRLRLTRNGTASQSNEIEVKMTSLGTVHLQPQTPDHGFEDRRVLLTMFRYEPVDWIMDWVRYHVQIHGVEAILLYANYVPEERRQELCTRLLEIPELVHFLVLRWDFPYGPVEGRAFASNVPRGSPRRASSCFCQTGMFEHARLRFLGKSRAVLNMDIDELAVVESGVSIFDVLEASETPVVLFREKRVSGDQKDLLKPLESRRHRHFCRLLNYKGNRARKWALSPQHIKPEAQWMTHQVLHEIASEPSDVWYGHFSPLNMGWKDSQRSQHCTENGVQKSGPLLHAFEHIGWGS